jgi:hypothetical protein
LALKCLKRHQIAKFNKKERKVRKDGRGEEEERGEWVGMWGKRTVGYRGRVWYRSLDGQ